LAEITIYWQFFLWARKKGTMADASRRGASVAATKGAGCHSVRFSEIPHKVTDIMDSDKVSYFFDAEVRIRQ
jgi:hypothetical protein